VEQKEIPKPSLVPLTLGDLKLLNIVQQMSNLGNSFEEGLAFMEHLSNTQFREAMGYQKAEKVSFGFVVVKEINIQKSIAYYTILLLTKLLPNISIK